MYTGGDQMFVLHYKKKWDWMQRLVLILEVLLLEVSITLGGIVCTIDRFDILGVVYSICLSTKIAISLTGRVNRRKVCVCALCHYYQRGRKSALVNKM